MKNTENKKNDKLQRAVLLRTIIPELIMCAVILITVILCTRSALEEEVYRSLESVAASVATAYDTMYPGDYELVGDKKVVSLYKGDKELTGDHAYLDRVRIASGMNVTLFYKDARILTTLKDDKGERYVGSGVHTTVISTMTGTEKPEPLHYKMEIESGKYYYACYVPLFNSDGSFVGMVGTAITAAEVRRKEDLAVAPTLLIVAAGLLAASVISRKYTNNIVSAIEGMHSFLAKMVAGRLSNEMPQEILKRDDEIGAMGQSIIHMQNAVRILVECDPLTTLYNRRCGDAKMKAVQKKALESGEPFCIAIGDIDFFKKVNDTYGHDAGDLVLKHVASELKNLMAGRGHAVRWGGEEFLLIFEDMRLIPVAASIETFLDKIKAARIKYGSQDIRVTMTMGLVEGKADRSMEEMIKEADEKLYYGKQNGRNQLVVTPGEPEPSYRLLLVEEMDMKRSDMVITFSDDLINSQNLMELFTDNALKGIEKGEDFVEENTKSEEEENDE